MIACRSPHLLASLAVLCAGAGLTALVLGSRSVPALATSPARAAVPVPPAAPPPPALPAPPPADVASEPAADPVWGAVPSVTADGNQIFVPYRGADGARGEANLSFDVWDRRGKLVRGQIVQSTEQWDTEGDAQVRRAVEEQHRAAATLLEELARAGLQPLPPDRFEHVSDARLTYTVNGADRPAVAIELSPTGTLTFTPAGHPSIVRRSRYWRSVPTAQEARALQQAWDAGRDGCYNPALLRGAQVDLQRRVAVVTIGYRGNDTCWESDDAYIVLAW